jgi:flagellar basal body-associated protein FliL
LLSDESLATVKKWVGQHWYLIVLIVVVIIALMVSGVNIFFVHVNHNKLFFAPKANSPPATENNFSPL